MKRRLFFALNLTLIFLLAPQPDVHAFSCSVTATPLSFGNYDTFSPLPRDATFSITVACTAPAKNPNAPIPATISLSPGNSGSFAQRTMQVLAGSTVLAYNLYTSPSFSTVWGDGSGGSQVQTNLVTRSTPWTATVYGRLPAGQNVAVGSYSDVITVTVMW